MFHATSDLKFSFTCSDMNPNGPFSAYFEEIHKIGKGQLKDGKLHGEFKYFYALQTVVLPFKEGSISGKVRQQNQTDPNRSFEVDVQDDVINGKKTFDSGRMEVFRYGLETTEPAVSEPKQALYKDSQLTLSASSCERNLSMNIVNEIDFLDKLECLKPNENNTQRIMTYLGIVRAEFQCKNDMPNGKLIVYQVTTPHEFLGTLLLQSNLKNGSLVGDYKRFGYGYPIQFGSIENGKLHGLITQHDSLGPIFSVQVKQGKCASDLTYFNQSKFNLAKSNEDLYLERKKIFVIVGMDWASGFGPPRFGPNLSLLKGECKDSCGGIGPTIGLYNKSRNEYYLGLAAGFAYMASGWTEVAVHSINRKVTGYHGSIAMGMGLMPFLELGYNLEAKRPSIKIGLTVKAPIYPLIK